MADIILHKLSHHEAREAIELLFFAYRDFTSEADSLLAAYGFGRAHHRAIYFVGRNPHITVSELLKILRITKQSLNRVLGELVSQGFIEQIPGSEDRRQRLLSLTAKGGELENLLTRKQTEMINKAFTHCGPESFKGFREILREMIEADDRKRFSEKR